MEKLELDFYYGKEAEQFTFYRLPKALITDERFKGISNNAKLLYGLMLDRMSLSKKRGWLDEENKVFIKYSLNNIEEDLSVSRKTASSILKELEAIGLIDMVQQTGVANIIYVKNFISESCQRSRKQSGTERVCKKAESIEKTPVENLNQCNYSTSVKNVPIEKGNWSKSRTSEEYKPMENINQCNFDVETEEIIPSVPGEFLHTNNIMINNKLNNNPICRSYQQSSLTDEMDEVSAYMELIKENIDYDIMMQNYEYEDREMYEELYQIICDVVCVERTTIRIAGEDYPYNLVKSKFLKLNSSHQLILIPRESAYSSMFISVL